MHDKSLFLICLHVFFLFFGPLSLAIIRTIQFLAHLNFLIHGPITAFLRLWFFEISLAILVSLS